MTPARMRAAISEAQRFIKRTKAALEDVEDREIGDAILFDWLPTGKKTGAARRASMDLTRALAEMRRAS